MTDDEKLRQLIFDFLLAEEAPNGWRTHAVITYSLWLGRASGAAILSSTTYKAFEAAVIGELCVLCASGKVQVKHAGPDPGSVLIYRATRVLESLAELSE